ncbi:MAG TPA: gliding motility-associated C-terminal domain-containing protein [Chitinophagaceae bacterium]|nr:gliding motility-associated C-terminal domain-containing protein [Chitinophagaceae bacterium]
MIRLLAITISILWVNIILAQVSPPVLKWQKPYGGSLEDFGEDVLLTSDGGFLILGAARSNDFEGSNPPHKIGFNVLLIKIDASREVSWTKEYGGDGLDYGLSIKPVAGGYIILAATNSNNFDVTGIHQPSASTFDIWILKIDNNGNLLWQRCYGGSGTELPGSIDITPTGGYIISGYTDSNDGDVSGNHGGGDIWVVELNSTGDILWQRCYGGSAKDGGGITKVVRSGGPPDGTISITIPLNQIKVLPGGGYILTAITESNDGDISGNHGNEDIWMTRLGPTGNILFKGCYGGNGLEMPCGVIPLSDGYVVGGTSGSTDAPFNNIGRNDGWMFKTDLNGNIIWQHNYGGTADEMCYDILQAADGGFYMVGGSQSINTCQNNANGNEDFWIMRTTKEGVWLWEKVQGGSKEDFATAIVEGTDGSLYVTGWEQSKDRDVVGHHNTTNVQFVANDMWLIILGFDGPDFTSKVTITASVEIICEGSPVEFKAHPINGGDLPVYFWYVNGIEQPEHSDIFITSSLNDGDKITCKMISRQTCIVDQEVMSNEITIHWYPNGRATGFLPEQITKCVNLYETIAPTRTFASYLWSTGATTPTIRVANPGLYWLEVTDVTGCSGRENVWVTTKSCMNAVYIPTAFTPNNDGKNDIFKPLIDGKLLQYRFRIYDRWGQLVLETTDPNKGWNGKRGSIDQDTNVYVWICAYQLEGQEAITDKGTFLLIR